MNIAIRILAVTLSVIGTMMVLYGFYKTGTRSWLLSADDARQVVWTINYTGGFILIAVSGLMAAILSLNHHDR